MDEKGWEIIHQRAHGLLAMQIGSHWRKDQRPKRWIETLLAIAEHDDGQEDWQGTNHLNEAGAPLDFALKPFNMVQLKRVTEMAQQKGRWIALLISKHLSFLYEQKRGETKALDHFLDQQKDNQEKWRKELKYTVKEVDAAYALMQWCDRFSLILARKELPEGERALEISIGPDGKKYEVVQRADETVVVTPWPFEEDHVEVAIEVSLVDTLHFESDAQLKEALWQSPVSEKKWRLSRK